ncbi:thiamine phosphate synthase [Aeromicrobium sp.]|uniref:thiamine phosphate synthase n=1 Tax=Aeromicrobium sp. TaxID=1871063 RepID=UPI0025BA5D4A|nr:thiamine phosphate synthase [Aeromicrobium sp.]
MPRIHLITHFPHLDEVALQLVTAVVDVGVDAIQVRAKGATDRELVAWTRAVVSVVRPRGARVLVNDRLDLALAAGADGVHLGSNDLPVADARAMVPAGFLIGATCRDGADAERARADGADYAGVGPVHASTTKIGLPAPIGLGALSAAALALPTIAIGGITAGRVPAVLRAGAHGVAVVAAVWQALDPPRAAKEIVDLVHAA